MIKKFNKFDKKFLTDYVTSLQYKINAIYFKYILIALLISFIAVVVVNSYFALFETKVMVDAILVLVTILLSIFSARDAAFKLKLEMEKTKILLYIAENIDKLSNHSETNNLNSVE